MIANVFTVVLLIALSLRPGTATTYHNNSYAPVKGCRQFDDPLGYNDNPQYVATSTFRNVGNTDHSRYFRFGVVCKNDGHIRFGHTEDPFNANVIELVLGGWMNTQTVARLQFRRSDNTYENVQLKEQFTPGLLHRSSPLMFTMEVFDTGLVTLTKDGEPQPFFQFSGNTVPAEYVTFVKFGYVDTVYFYDCPLNDERTAIIDGVDAVLLRCGLAAQS